MPTVNVDVPAGVKADLDHLASLTGLSRATLLEIAVGNGIRDALDSLGLREAEYPTEHLAVNVPAEMSADLGRLADVSGDSREAVLRQIVTESVRSALVVIARKSKPRVPQGRGAFGQVLN